MEKKKLKIKLITFCTKTNLFVSKIVFSRVFKKLIKKNLSPAGLSYFLSFIFLFIPIPITISKALTTYITSGYLSELNFMSLIFSVILFFILFFFGVLFDVQENKNLIGIK